MDSVSGPATTEDVGPNTAINANDAAATGDALRAYFAGFGIADKAKLDALTARFATLAQAEQAVGAWFTGLFGNDIARVELAADIGRLAALKSGAFARRPELFLDAAELGTDVGARLRQAMPEPPTVSLMTPMPTQSLSRVRFVPSARRALALLQIRRA